MSRALADSIMGTLTSPNECDSNGETANVVDGLFAIGRSIGKGLGTYGSDPNYLKQIADNIGFLQAALHTDSVHGRNVATGVHAIADAINNLADAIRSSSVGGVDRDG